MPVLETHGDLTLEFLQSICLENQLLSKVHRIVRVIAGSEDNHIVGAVASNFLMLN